MWFGRLSCDNYVGTILSCFKGDRFADASRSTRDEEGTSGKLSRLLGAPFRVDLARRGHQFRSEVARRVLVSVDDRQQMGDVGDGQPERFDLCGVVGEFGIVRDVRDAITQRAVGRVDALRPAAFLLVGRIAAFDHAYHGQPVAGNHACGGRVGVQVHRMIVTAGAGHNVHRRAVSAVVSFIRHGDEDVEGDAEEEEDDDEDEQETADE
uniref:Uncharacterized protein n=1 Tax=Anopheles atroparvus TaxID=41427 RepID=A0A182JM69_ANOAO